MEYLATTPGDAIPSGAIVVVTNVLGSDTVQVKAVAKSLYPNGRGTSIILHCSAR